MKLISLKLENFKKHREFEADFADGLTVIRGPNWSGKSTVLYGVLFGLFGVHGVPGKKDDLQAWGSKGELRVELTTSEGTITRTLSNAEVVVNGEQIATGISSVDLWVSQQFGGLDRSRLIELLFSPQSETAAILTLGVQTLHRLVERLSGATLIEQMVQATKTKSGEYELAQARLGPSPERPEVEPYTVEDRQKELKARLEDAKASHRAWEAWQSALKSHQRLVANKPVPPDDTGSDIDVAALEGQLSEAKAIKVQQERRQTLLDWFDTTGAKWERLAGNIEEHEKISERIEGAEEIERDLSQQVQKLRASVQSLEDSFCSQCKRPLGEVREDALEGARSHLAMVREKWAEAKQRLSDLKVSLAKLELPPADYESRYNQLADELESLPEVPVPNEVWLTQQIRLGRKYQDEASRYNGELAAWEKTIRDVEMDLEGYPEGLSDQSETIRELDMALRANYQELVDCRAVQALWDSFNERDQLWKQHSKKLEGKAVRFTEFGKWLKKLKGEVLKAAWDDICVQASEFIAQASGGRATAVALSDNGFTITEGGREVTAAVVSGGMRAIAGTGVKLALGSQLGFLILDEATSELNNENAANMTVALGAASRQILLVTHRSDDEMVADTVVDVG